MQLTLFNFMSPPDGEGFIVSLDGLMIESEVELTLYHVHPLDSETNKREKCALAKLGCVLTQDMVTELRMAHLEEDAKETPALRGNVQPLLLDYLAGVLTPVEYDIYGSDGFSHGDGNFMKILRRNLKATLSSTMEVLNEPERTDEIGYGFVTVVNQLPDMTADPASNDDFRHALLHMVSILNPSNQGVRATHDIKMELFSPVQFILTAVGK